MTRRIESRGRTKPQGFRRLLLRFIFLALVSTPPQLYAEEKAIERPSMWGTDDLRRFIKDFDEPLLWSEKTQHEAYRLLISRTIRIGDGGKTVRLERRGDNSWVLTAKSIDKGRFRRWIKRLTTAVVQQLRDLIQRGDFWQAPVNGMFVDNSNDNKNELPNLCFDGVYWILEANVGGRYHATGAQICGRDNVLVPGGLMLIKMSGRDLTTGMID
jgi:hypothetical protein